MANTISKPDTKNVAILLNGEPDVDLLTTWLETFAKHKINYSIIDSKLRNLNMTVKVTDTYATADSSLFDAALLMNNEPFIQTPALEFIQTTYKHYKPLALAMSNPNALADSRINKDDPGVFNVSSASIHSFIDGIAQGRFWNRIK
nr:hypothetical protein [Neobacillus soli]